MSADEEWVQAAMSDDAMVVDLLVRLHRPTLPLHWSVRQPRSKSSSLHHASPTTPLSWSAGEDSTQSPPLFKLPHTTRSKVNCDSEKIPSKRPRKKKTLAQLREEENLLVKERRDLNREITALRMKLKSERATNVSLKRMKLELKPDPNRVAISSQEQSVSDQPMSSMMGNNTAQQPSASNNSLEQNEDAKFVLPDLNMPFEDSSSDLLGVS